MCRFLLLFGLLCSGVVSAIEIPAEVSRYHQVLKKRPLNEQLYTRFYEGWMEHSNSAELELFLKEQGSAWQDSVLLARYYIRVGNRDLGIAALAKAIEGAGESTSSLHLMRARLLMLELEFRKAIQDLELVGDGASAEEQLEATRLLGVCYLRVERVDDAITHGTSASRSDFNQLATPGSGSIPISRTTSRYSSSLRSDILRISDSSLLQPKKSGMISSFFMPNVVLKNPSGRLEDCSRARRRQLSS